eukprot:jgi/Antlo1/803/211
MCCFSSASFEANAYCSLKCQGILSCGKGDANYIQFDRLQY